MSTNVIKYYDQTKKRETLVLSNRLTQLRPRVSRIVMDNDKTTLKMTPKWFPNDDRSESLKDIIYPSGTTDYRAFDTVAYYRSACNQLGRNFVKKALDVKESSTEMMVVALDRFAHQLGGELKFSDQDISFSSCVHETACGVANLNSIHLLITNQIPTARFIFNADLSYEHDLAWSSETMQNFVLSFAKSIANVLCCDPDYVRIFSVCKSKNSSKTTYIDFGVTTPDQTATKELAKSLQVKHLFNRIESIFENYNF
jgi:hypothetical protein